jgi:phosphatidylglycerophosphatase A
MDKLFMFIATGAYSGYLPKAPGTWGSLVGILLWMVGLHRLDPRAYAIMLIGILLIGTVAAGAAEKIVDQGDPGLVVIDEILGQLITLAFLSWHPLTAVVGFALFRFFDILKPFPVSWLDQHIHGGLGIMLDDVMAGIYALLVLQGLIWLVGS